MQARINATGLEQIATALGKYHKLGRDHFTPAMLGAWASDAEESFANGNGCYIEIHAMDSVTGAPVEVTITTDGYDVEAGQTYTIAYDTTSGMLLASVVDGADLEAALAEFEAAAGVTIDRADITVEAGVILTDEPLDTDVLVFECGSHTGTLVDAAGTEYRYAVRRA